jgi:uncharacterized membrane protein SpoIIM required for sporulation
MRLLLLLGFFAAGMTGGSLFARLGGTADWTQLSACVRQSLDGERPGFFSVLSVNLRYPLLLLLSGLTVWSIWAPLTILAARGFFLSYTVTCFALVYGGRGYVLSLTLVLFHGLLLLPLLFLLGQWSVQRAAEAGHCASKSFQRQEALLCTVVLTLVLASTILETVFLPVCLAGIRALIGI